MIRARASAFSGHNEKGGMQDKFFDQEVELSIGPGGTKLTEDIVKVEAWRKSRPPPASDDGLLGLACSTRLRVNPAQSLQLCPLRQQLQFDRLQERYRTPVISSPSEFDVDNDQDTASLGTPPPFLSPIRCPSPLRLDSSLTFSRDDLNNDIDNNLPAMFRRQSSIRTEGGDTTVQGSEYIPTAASQCDSDESDCEETNEEGDNAMRKYRIVANDQLHKLFRRCQECGGVIDTSLLSIRTEGSACVVDYTCLECGPGTWKSQGRIGKGMSTVYEGNQEIAISSFVTGLPLPRLIDCAAVLGLSLPSERTMRRTIRDIGCPAIDNVFMKWQTQVRNVSKAAAGPAGIAVSIDGQYDSPGFNAQNCKVTVIDAKEKLAIAGVNLHKNEPGIDGKSIRMEATGALRAIKELLDDNFVIKTRVTDSNASVDEKLREDPQTESIEAEIDWWHTQKSRMKTSPVLGQLYQPFFNHLFYCHAKFPDKEDRPKALEYVRSFLKHVQGKHSWKKSEIFSIVTKCDHEQLKRRKQGEPPRPTLEILRESEQVRRDLEEGRLMSRIGMPTDLVFDELCIWEANRNGQMVNEDDISDEEDGDEEVFEEGEDDIVISINSESKYVICPE
ncbi:hypothetical protein PRIPAC_96884 [Pristionchus pacificus]|uniref:Uncharacterized protein n=1 Tax=Pristionchus pacificus TaxID=54126 RepID=A0A2A6BCG0_PRIPA|nr:hypothetical protein PRIPAC_96884 [Pristionchus pacificus]|eukprot:PDM63580.1 hypothetical protein PRIPAC_49553 [Pristionchus pacificus]